MASKFALVIANTEYQDASFARLTAPGRDAEEFAQVLQDPELAGFNDVQILLNEEESKIRRSIARFFVNHQRDDLLLLYFSGHGVRNEQGQLFLAANDTEISILDATSIPADFVTHAMNNSRSQRQLLILDCCNSGAFAHGSKSAAAIGKSMGIATAFEGSGFGRVVLTATDATQYAWEGDKVIGNTQKSVFTHFLIEGLKGEADRDSDGRIHVDELYDYAYEQVVRQTPKQTPGKWSYKQQGDLVLRENLKPRDVKPAPLPPDLLEMLSHPNSGVRRAGIQELISLLDGKHLGLARAAQDKLRAITENDDSLTLRKTASDTLIARGLLIEPPAPVEIPQEERREQKRIEKPPIIPPQASPSPVRRRVTGEVQPRILPEQKKVVPQLNLRLIGGIVGGLLVVTLFILGGVKLLNNMLTVAPEPTTTLQPIVTRTLQPEKTDTPSPRTETSIPPTPAFGIGSRMAGKDGMTLLYVPAGEFTMGTYNGGDKEKPPHKVTLDAFWIDQTEVTNYMYANCVQDGVCNQPRQVKSATRDDYYGNSEYENYPVFYVSWEDSNSYCSWAGRHLPTEAEWEKAARGDDARDFPWGNNRPNNTLLNYNEIGIGDTTEVGNYPNGASPYGALDMAGNVSEWVADWYRSSYYANSPSANPPGPEQGTARVYRGGSWNGYFGEFPCFTSKCNTWITTNGLISWMRSWDSPNAANQYVGFRCAMSAAP